MPTIWSVADPNVDLGGISFIVSAEIASTKDKLWNSLDVPLGLHASGIMKLIARVDERRDKFAQPSSHLKSRNQI